MSRTYKRPYTKSKRFDKSCRCHGGCGWCEGNRTIQTKKVKVKIFDGLKEALEDVIRGDNGH